MSAFISHINQVIIRAINREELFQKACDIAVNYGNFSLARFSVVDEGSKYIEPLAWSGKEDGYLKNIKISSENNLPEGQGPVGNAFRTGKYFICNNIMDDPCMQPWKQDALLQG